MNATAIPPLTESQEAQVSLYRILTPIFAAFCVAINAAVVVSSGLILKKNQQPKTTYLFLGNVAMTDAITSVAIMLSILLPKANRSHNMCAFQMGLIVSSTLASVFSVGLIAIDRFLFIGYGIFYSRWMYPHRARALIAAIWTVACIVGFLPLMGWSNSTDGGRVCWFIIIAPRGLLLLTVLLGGASIVVVIVLNALILRKALTSIDHVQRADSSRMSFDDGLRRSRHPQVSQPSKWRAVKVVTLTFGSFVVTWGPYFVASVIYAYSEDARTCGVLKGLIASPLAALGFLNSVLNPMIYAWWHKGFRKFVRQRCCWKRRVGAAAVARNDGSSSSKKDDTTTTATASSAKRESSGDEAGPS